MHPSAQVSSPFNNIQIMGLVPSACQCPHRVWSPEKVPRISPQSWLPVWDGLRPPPHPTIPPAAWVLPVLEAELRRGPRSLCAWPFPGCSSRRWCATVLWEDLGCWRKLRPRREAEEPEDQCPWLLSSPLAFPTLGSPFWTPPSAGLSAASCWDLCTPFKAWSPALYPPISCHCFRS